MIASHHEMTIVQGSSIEIAQEYTAITQTLLNKTPEMFLAMTVALYDDIEEAMSKENETKLVSYVEIISKFVEMNKEGGKFLNE